MRCDVMCWLHASHIPLFAACALLGNKLSDVKIVYTMWSNLHKRRDMDVGQIGFHEQKQVHMQRRQLSWQVLLSVLLSC